MKWLIALVLCFALAGCESSPNIPDLEQNLVRIYNEQATREGKSVQCVKAELVKETSSTYKGTITLSDGRLGAVEVTTDGEKLTFRTLD